MIGIAEKCDNIPLRYKTMRMSLSSTFLDRRPGAISTTQTLAALRWTYFSLADEIVQGWVDKTLVYHASVQSNKRTS